MLSLLFFKVCLQTVFPFIMWDSTSTAMTERDWCAETDPFIWCSGEGGLVSLRSRGFCGVWIMTDVSSQSWEPITGPTAAPNTPKRSHVQVHSTTSLHVSFSGLLQLCCSEGLFQLEQPDILHRIYRTYQTEDIYSSARKEVQMVCCYAKFG